MNHLTMLVTAEGKWVLPASEEFFAALGDPVPDYDAVGFAVRNLGFIKFDVLDRLVTEIELHPRNVDLPALLAVESQLGQVTTNLFRIKYLADDWKSEISASAEHTLARLRALCAPVFDPPPNQRFRVEPQKPGDLFDTQAGRDDPFGRMAMKWRVAFGNFDESVLELASRNDLLSLTAIVAVRDKRNADPVFRFIGDGHRWADPRFKVTGLGEKVENMPDREYGQWITEFHRSVATSGEPRYDIVTADMQIAGEAAPASRRAVRYERLLLPWRTPSGEVFITSCAKKFSTGRAANLLPDKSDNSTDK